MSENASPPPNQLTPFERNEPIADEPIVPRSESQTRAQSHRSLFWPMMLIGFGVILLLSNMGFFPSTSWAVLWRLWPIALIALGIDVLIGHRSVLGAIASGVLALLLIGLAIGVALLADQIPALIELAKPAELVAEHVEHPLGEITQARISIDWASSPGYLSSLSDSDNLIEADITYRGELAFDVDVDGKRADISLDSYLQGVSYGSFNFDDPNARWDVKLHPVPQYELYLDSGSGSYDYDLTSLHVRNIELDAESGNVRVRFPSEGMITAKFNTGSGQVDLIIPRNLGVRIALDPGSGAFRPDDRFIKVSLDNNDDDVIWQTENYLEAQHIVELKIDQGSGIIKVRDAGN
jgi:hypothetical protein